MVKDIENLFLKIRKIHKPNKILYDIFEVDSFKSVKFSNLSGGMKQKFLLSLTFMTEPELIMLDEPFASLDLKSTKILINYLQKIKKQKTILMISHYFNKLGPLVDNILIMNNGKIVLNSSIDELHTNKELSDIEDRIFDLFDEYV